MKAETQVAIQAYNILDRRQLAVEMAVRELRRAVALVPEEDMPIYVHITEEIAAKRNFYREQRGL